MPQYSWIELAIMAFIFISLCVLVWRGGQANPESTGRVIKRVSKLESKMGGFEGELELLKERVTQLDEAVERMILKMATKEDLQHLRDLMENDAKMNEKTWNAVHRIENFFLEKGVNGK
jgi:uncharacterized protein YoxC